VKKRATEYINGLLEKKKKLVASAAQESLSHKGDMEIGILKKLKK